MWNMCATNPCDRSVVPVCCFCVFISLAANPVSTRIATVVFTDDVAQLPAVFRYNVKYLSV